MIKDTIQFWSEDKIATCLQYWSDTPASSPSQGELLRLFQDPEKIIFVLTKLEAPAALLISRLVAFEGVTTRGRLNEGKVIEKSLFENALLELSDAGLICVMKNRARLDNTIDKIYLNEFLYAYVSEHELLFTTGEQESGFSLDAKGEIDLQTLLAFGGGAVPQFVIDSYGFRIELDQAIKQGMVKQCLLLLDGVFLPAYRGDVAQPEPGFSEGPSIIYQDGLHTFALFLLMLKKRVFRIDESMQLRVRDQDTIAQQLGISRDRVLAVFLFLKEHSFLEFQDEQVCLSRVARLWLCDDLENRFKQLQTAVSSSDMKDDSSLIFLYQQLFGEIRLSSKPDYVRSLRDFVNMRNNIELQWQLGLLARRLDGTRCRSYSKFLFSLDEPLVPGSLFVSGNMELHIFKEKLTQWQYLYLRGFCDFENSENVIIAVLSVDSFRRGLLLGYDGDRFLTMLEEASEKPLPQNVVFSIRDWIDTQGKVVVSRSFLLRADADLIELVLHDKDLSLFVKERISDTYLLLEFFDEREMSGLLEKYHIFLNYDV